MGQLVKAYIYNEDKQCIVFDCLFNPTDYTFAKRNEWEAKALTGANVPAASFKGGGIMTMTFQLLFDTYDPGARSNALTKHKLGQDDYAEPLGIPQNDVRYYTEMLLNLMNIDKDIKDKDKKANKGRPPICSFHWGNYWSFKGVITSVNLKFTLFTEEGRPVRATADVTLQQVKESGTYPAQNPTSGGDGTRHVRVVQAGDTLDLIAYQEYGDATLWRPLARANGLEDPRVLRPGQRLKVPAL